jgi:putative sigma-54 modulation protein
MINLTITDKELKATEAIKDYVEKKLTRVEKYFGDEKIEVNVKTKAEKNYQVAEIYVSANGTSYKAVTEDKDLYASIDKDIDILEGQIRKSKTKKEKMQKDASIKQITFNGEESVEVEDEVVKTLHYEIKPMSVEDAKIKLVETQNVFYTFINVDTNKVNVLFRLKDGKNFGIVEPEA